MTGKEKDDGPGLRVKVERMTERGTTVYSCPVCGRELFSVDGILIGVKDFDTCPNCGLKIWWMDAIGDGLSWAEEIGANKTGRMAQIYALKGGKAEIPWPGENTQEDGRQKMEHQTYTIEWIPVEEQFPNIDEWVLVTVDNGECLSVFEAWCDEDQCWRENSGKALSGYVEVIAWAEMPEPYKCKDEREEGEE